MQQLLIAEQWLKSFLVCRKCFKKVWVSCQQQCYIYNSDALMFIMSVLFIMSVSLLRDLQGAWNTHLIWVTYTYNPSYNLYNMQYTIYQGPNNGSWKHSYFCLCFLVRGACRIVVIFWGDFVPTWSTPPSIQPDWTYYLWLGHPLNGGPKLAQNGGVCFLKCHLKTASEMHVAPWIS